MMKGLARLIILGTLCVFSTEASTCFDGYCQNGGTCSNFQGKANCSCSSYFTGDQCQLDVDECQVYNQCKNGGTCSNTFGGYICGCIYGWDGPDCSINKDECLPAGNTPLCYNGGTCVDRIGKYDCICPPGKMGPVCQHDDECFYKPCFGGATCSTNAFGQYACNCPRGWTDKKCNIDVDECNRAKFSPCDHGGTCINTPGSFTCICAPGYTGQQVCVKLVVNTSSASTPPSLSVLASLPTSTPTRSSPKPSVVASISLTPELPTRATITISKDATRVEGQNVLFNCKVDGYPPPSVTWTKNGGELRAGENPRITDSSTSDNHTLNITHIQRSDAGQYRCFLHNSDGNLTSSPATLTVHFAPAFLDPWQLNINITRRTAEGNAHLAVNCTVEGNPSPLLYWTKNGKKLNVTANPRLSTVSSRGIHSLNVINLNRSDAGFYRCVAVNIVGKAVSHGENLRVNYKPVVDISAYGKRLLKISSQIQLICQYNASPPVSEVQWEKDGIVIARNATVIGDARTNVSKFTVSESLLSIMLISAQDGGKYTCFAANVLGNSSATTSVRIQVQPNPPKMLKLDSRGSRTLQISWTAGFDGNDAIKYYTVEISEDNKRFSNAVCQGTLFSRACVVSTEKASLTDLSPWTSYYIRVFAENAVGRSNSSLVRSFSTEEEEPSAAPQNVKGTTTSSTSILVTWNEVPLADRNGFILTHTITYHLPTESDIPSITVKANEFHKGLTGLKESANYSITVFSSNQIGDGPASKPIFVTTGQDNKDGFSFQFIWGSVGAFAVLVCVVSVAIAMKRIRRNREDSLVMEKNNEENVSMLEITPNIINLLRDHSQQIPIEEPAEVPNSGAEEVVVVDSETYLDQMEIDRNWEIPRERLEILETKLGGGEFGVVKKGNYLRGDGNKLPVAVKMLKDENDQTQRMALIQELEILRKVGRHKNIVSLVGACSFEEPLCVIIEFVPGASLDQLLLKSRIPTRTEDANYANLWSRLSERDLLRIAKDVANGMQHLESKLCVHRDLAARNILIGKGLVAKISDFGLSRNISQDGEYIKRTEGRVPWLWMSMESLRGINTTMSDVWSFGVVLWEIVTLGKRPYAGVTGIVEPYTMLQDGFRLEKPPHCSKTMYDIMLQCWQETPEDRPTFKDLHSKLHSILCEPAVSYVNITHFQEQINEMEEADTLNCFV